MQDCILDEGSGRVRLMAIEDGRQELTIARPNEDYYYGFRVRNYQLTVDGVKGEFLIASEDPLEDAYASELVYQLKSKPITTQTN